MSHFFAEFDLCGSPSCVVRKDTRVYYHLQNPACTLQGEGTCVGVVWMCNPGSASHPAGAVSWAAIAPDPTLRVVHKLYQQAISAKVPPGPPNPDAYILVLNCYYSVDVNPVAAYAAWLKSTCTYKEKIPKSATFIVVAWGGGKPCGPVYQAIRTIKRRKNKLGKSLLVVCLDILHGATPVLAHRLSAINYPAHPLNPQFISNLPKIAATVAPFL